jgi:uncharacterized protein (TIGR02118 family)
MITIMGLLAFGENFDRARAQVQAAPTTPEDGVSLLGQTLNFVSDRSQLGIEYARGSLEVDCIAQHLFQDLSGSVGSADAGRFNLLGGLDEDDIVSMTVVTALQNTVIAPPRSGAVKRMSLLRKRADVTSEQFQDEWFNMHAIMLKRMPGILGYRQNLVIDAPKDDDGLVVDGIVELWFESTATIDAAFRSPRGTTTMTHAKEFIDKITTYMVDPVSIVAER